MQETYKARIRLLLCILAGALILLFSIANPISQAQDVPVISSGFIPPIPSPYLSGYGYLSDWPCQVGQTLHPGEDLKDSNNDLVIRAIADGRVRFVDQSDPLTGFGYHLEIEHALPEGPHIYSHYAHLDAIFVPEGMTFTKGKPLGRMGATGNATGVHLHFEIRTQDLPTDEWPDCTMNLEQDRQSIIDWIEGGDIPRYTPPRQFINYREIGDQLILFEHTFYRGLQFPLQNPGFYNLPPTRDEKASSIAIPDGWSAVVYKQVDGEGGPLEKRTLHSNDVDFRDDQFFDGTPLNDNISAIEVLIPSSTGSCPPGCEVNGDGNVGGEEYLFVVRDNWDCGIDNPPCPPGCEVNGDGNVGGEEYLFVVRDNWDCGLPPVTGYLSGQHEKKIIAFANMGTFHIEPASQLISPGDPVTVTIVMDPGIYDITTLRFQLDFPEDKLSLDPDDVKTELAFRNWEEISRVVGTGAVRLALGCGNPCTAYPSTNGPVTVATIRFTSNPSVDGATAELSFNPYSSLTKILNDDPVAQDVLGSAAPGTVSFIRSRTYLPVVLKSR